MYLDSAINGRPTIIGNVFHPCLMNAFRMHALLTSVARILNARYLARVIEECSRSVCKHLVGIRQRNNINICLSNTETKWICMEAFYRKINCHRRIYKQVLVQVRQLRDGYRMNMPVAKFHTLASAVGKRIPYNFRKIKIRTNLHKKRVSKLST